MSKKQVIIMWVGIAVLILMFLYPPWVYSVDAYTSYSGGLGSSSESSRVTKDAGYALLTRPPQPISLGRWSPDYCSVRINKAKLGLQSVIVIIVFAGLIVSFGKRSRKSGSGERQKHPTDEES